MFENRSLWASLLALGLAVSAAGAGTFAQFSDTETSATNTIQAGTLDLTVGESDALELTLSDVAPGDSGLETASVANAGSIEGGLAVELNVLSTGEGDMPESEATFEQSGEMLDELEVEVGFDDDTTDSTRLPVLAAASIGTVDKQGERDALKRLGPSESTNLYVDWSLDDDALNEIQGDNVTFEVVVTLHQSEPIVVDDDGTADFSSLQAAVDAAGSGAVIDVQPGTYEETVTVDTADLQILGAGSGQVTVDTLGASDGITVTASGVQIHGMTVQNATQAIDINDGKPRLSGFTVSDVVLGEKVDGRALTVDYSDDVVLKDITSNNNGNDGVTVWYTNDVRLEDITANDNGDNGIYWNGDDVRLLDAVAKRNADEGVDANWYDDLGDVPQETTLDNVVAKDNGEDDVELHDNGGDNATAQDSKLLKHVETGGAPTGLRLVQVASDEVEIVSSSFPNGILDGNDNDVDP